jgi:hypothetical protein
MNDTTNVNAPEVKLTREQKLRAKYAAIVARIEKDTAAAAELADEINSIAALAAIAEGSAVVVKLGRRFSEEKDTTRFVEGVVIGVKEDEDGSKLYKVQYGTGFDADIATVTGAALSLPAAAE